MNGRTLAVAVASGYKFNSGLIEELTLAQIRFLELVMAELTGTPIKKFKRVSTSELSEDELARF